MKFIYDGAPQKIRIGGVNKQFYWITLKKGEIDLPEEVGRNLKLLPVKNKMELTTGKIGQTKVETKQFKESFEKKLKKIKGIGIKTAQDILNVFPTEQDLKEAISNKKELPFRDDVEKKLRRKYGK